MTHTMNQHAKLPIGMLYLREDVPAGMYVMRNANLGSSFNVLLKLIRQCNSMSYTVRPVLTGTYNSYVLNLCDSCLVRFTYNSYVLNIFSEIHAWYASRDTY